MFFTMISFLGLPAIFGQKVDWKVEYSGAMREMFETGNVDGKIEVNKLKPKKHLYAVGPLEDLSGEILIWDGVPLTSLVKDKVVIVATNPNAKAVFFVWANVAKWTEIPVPPNIKTYDQIEEYIAETAENMNLNSAEPFPFLLKGTFQSVEFHINNYGQDGTKLTREKHDAMKYKSTLQESSLVMLGFYSRKHQGIFTHHTRTSHIHVTDKKRSFVGHVDELVLGEKMRLFLPVK